MMLVGWMWAMAFLPTTSLSGQANPAGEVQSVRLATLRFLTQQLDYMHTNYREAPFRVLMQTPLAMTVEGNTIRKTATPPMVRSETELAAMAAQWGGRLATPEDAITCGNPGGCRGTHGLLVTIGEPIIMGDSATIVSLIQRSSSDSTRFVMVPPETRAIFLRRIGGLWRVVAFAHAGQGSFHTTFPVDSLGGPLKQ